jgi:hypothetical protein
VKSAYRNVACQPDWPNSHIPIRPFLGRNLLGVGWCYISCAMGPLIFLVMTGMFLAIIGGIVLTLVPALRLTLPNLLLFVIGAYPGALVGFYIYYRTVAGDYLTENGFFPFALVGAVLGGTLLVWLKGRYVKTSKSPPLPK